MRVFVYGSLKRGKKLHSLLENAKFLGEAITCNKYPMILSKSKWYPYLIEKKGVGYNIKGEVYEVSPSLLKKLDIIEETPFYYYRKKIPICLNKKRILAWVYFVRKIPKFNKRDLRDEF